MGVLLFKNRQHAKEFIRSFATFELALAFEVARTCAALFLRQLASSFCDCAGVSGGVGHSRSAPWPILLRFRCLNATNLILFAGDSLMTVSVWENQQKPWVQALVTPYVCTFGVACIVSIGTMGYKLRLLAKKHCLRRAEDDIGVHSLDGLEVPHEFADHDAIKQLKNKFDENNLMVKKMYCALLLGLFESTPYFVFATRAACMALFLRHDDGSHVFELADAPMSALSLYYLTWSVQECTKSAYDNRSPPYTLVVCDLPMETKQLMAFVLSTVTSVGMLAFKLAKISLIRLRWSEREMLQVERTRLLAELAQQAQGSGPPLTSAPVPAADGSDAAPAAPALGAIVPAHVAAASGAHNIVASAPVLALSSAAAPAPALAELDPAFTLARNVPAASHAPGSSAAGPSNVSQEPRAFRGVCPACRRDVYTSDEGRVKEGDHYYHPECVKGACTLCSKNVYGDQERGRDGDAYYHIQCPER